MSCWHDLTRFRASSPDRRRLANARAICVSDAEAASDNTCDYLIEFRLESIEQFLLFYSEEKLPRIEKSVYSLAPGKRELAACNSIRATGWKGTPTTCWFAAAIEKPLTEAMRNYGSFFPTERLEAKSTVKKLENQQNANALCCYTSSGS